MFDTCQLDLEVINSNVGQKWQYCVTKFCFNLHTPDDYLIDYDNTNILINSASPNPHYGDLAQNFMITH